MTFVVVEVMIAVAWNSNQEPLDSVVEHVERNYYTSVVVVVVVAVEVLVDSRGYGPHSDSDDVEYEMVLVERTSSLD